MPCLLFNTSLEAFLCSVCVLSLCSHENNLKLDSIAQTEARGYSTSVSKTKIAVCLFVCLVLTKPLPYNFLFYYIIYYHYRERLLEECLVNFSLL